jgi:hypothetical protein
MDSLQIFTVMEKRIKNEKNKNHSIFYTMGCDEFRTV